MPDLRIANGLGFRIVARLTRLAIRGIAAMSEGASMFSYYGSKSKIIDLYPAPKYGKIIEPFAGSARYALKYWDRDVVLIDKYPVIARIWKWLQLASRADIMKLPEPNIGETIDRKYFDCVEAAWLMGFLVQQGVNAPRLTVSPFADIRTQKKNIAGNLDKIRHWEIVCGEYNVIANIQATWFIDPPYSTDKDNYVEPSSAIDYAELSRWTKSRQGQVIVCENMNAGWLPFTPLRRFVGTIGKISTEAIWCNDVAQLALI